ncbi:MAG: hypothetical protein SV760_05955, partial [Halobacteria archaeon]|nr:hypothetical protein [Halobacteria archaeon]
MGNFEDHMRYGVASYLLLLVAVGAATVYGVRSGVVEVGTGVTVGVGSAVLGFPLTMAGAGFPDIDHQDAKPHRWLRKWLSVSAGGVSVYGLLVAARGLTE